MSRGVYRLPPAGAWAGRLRVAATAYTGRTPPVSENDTLLIRGDAPSQDVKNEVWNRIKAIDPGYPDLVADIDIDSSLPQPAPAHEAATAPLPASGAAPSQQDYEVAPGDSLSKIARRFYGDANQYKRIFEANRDQLQDPDRIRVGQRLRIPR